MLENNMKKIFCQIITIGDEILFGHILDSNAQWLSFELDKIGIITKKRVTIGDNKKDILETLKNSINSNDIIIMTGGLGPTNDDITKNCLSEFFNSTLTLNEEALNDIKNLFEKRNLELTKKNISQAYLPKCAKKITNINGTAPGIWIEKNQKIIISLPGVPFEMKEIMKNKCLISIKNKFKLPVIYHKIIKTIGIGESWLADKIQVWENNLDKNIKLAYLPSIGQVKLRLTTSGKNIISLKKNIHKEIEKIKPTIEKYIYGYDDENIEYSISKLLINKKKTIAIAESCTGGLLSHKLTSISGSSKYFLGSIVCYDNNIKKNELNISQKKLDTYGAVSEEVVKDMAKNIRNKYNSSIGLATSGIAGPSGGTKNKPVGTVFIAYSDSKNTISKKLLLTRERYLNNELTCLNILNMIRLKLLNYI